MNQTLEETLVLCDLDSLMLGPDGNLTQVMRDVLQLFAARGGRLTVFSQRTPRAARTVLGSLRLAAPALLCGGSLVYSFASGNGLPMGSFTAMGDDFLAKLPSVPGVGVALQMQDGTTRVLRMSRVLEQHLRQEWTPYLLGKAEDLRSSEVLRVLLYLDNRSIPLIQMFEKALSESNAPIQIEHLGPDCLVLAPQELSMEEAFSAMCEADGIVPEQVAVMAGSMPMLDAVRLAGRSAAAADAPPELQISAGKIMLCRGAEGAAAEFLYGLVRESENAR